MANITVNNDHIPAPQRDRDGHVPAPGDIYYGKNTRYPTFYRIDAVLGDGFFQISSFDFEAGEFVPKGRESAGTLKEYYTLCLGDFNELWTMAKAGAEGDDTAIRALLDENSAKSEETALVASRPAEQVLALTEASERMEDKLQTISHMMEIAISHMRSKMEARLSVFNKELERVKDYVRDLQRIITVMNLYTGANVDVVVVNDGTPALAGLPIHVRQRILFMDEEFLADAENGGIDCHDIGRFCEWMKNPQNYTIICPEPKCIVAMKPKRYDKGYSSDYYTNKALNQWNHHTIIFFRDGERILMVDSEDLELYGTAVPYTDQAERFEKEYQEIMSERSFQESNLKRLSKKSQALGYMYAKYASFLQGMVDSGKIFDLSGGRPNFAKEEGVVYIHDEELAIGTGQSWADFQKGLNEHIRRGSRVIYFPYGQDEHGYSVKAGEPNRYYYREGSEPSGPKKGLYSVDYPTKTEHEKNPETRRWESVQKTGDKLAIFYKPESRWWRDVKPRTEAWIYNPWCVVNYDALTVEDIDRFMADRTQRKSFRLWMPVLQEARKWLVKEAEDEQLFIRLMERDLSKDVRTASSEAIREAVEEAVRWWKNKVIFTRPLRSDDAKAWRMIRKHCEKMLRK